MPSRTYEEVEVICEAVGLRCTPAFAEPLMSGVRERLYFGGWRSSKTTHECLEALLWILDWLRQSRDTKWLIWLVGPDYKQTREEYRYLREWCQRLGFTVTASDAQEGPREMTISRGSFVVVVETKSAQDPATLASVAPDLILACESGQLSDEVCDMIRGRAGQKNAPMVWGGTVEDDEGHAQWAWYQETARQWLDQPTSRHQAWCLPSWENPMFYSCLPWVEDDPELGRSYCPDGNHGEAHGHRQHPVIRQWEDNFDGFTFARRIAAIPTGVQYAVYPQTNEKALLQPISQVARLGFFTSAGGVDYGTTTDHPSALVVVQLTNDPRDAQVSFVGPRGIAWVRECITLHDNGDTFTLQKARKELSERWKCYRWNVDPRERFMAKNWEGEATTYSESGREARVGLVTARLNLSKLMFDMSGPGVSDLYEEMKRVHRRKTKDGQLKYVRLGDDRTAALEDAIEALDGEKPLKLPKPTRVKIGARRVQRSTVAV